MDLLGFVLCYLFQGEWELSWSSLVVIWKSEK